MRVQSEKELNDMGFYEVAPGRFARMDSVQRKAVEEKKKKASPFAHLKNGKYTIGGHTYNFRSRAEAIYAHFLELQKNDGQISSWHYECHKFKFHSVTSGNNSYTPDFKVVEREGKGYYWVEVKGYMTPASKTKLKRMALYYPDEKIVVVMQHEINEIKKSGLVPKEILGDSW